MQDAARRCRIAIPVLAESYGNSVRCLDELAIMFQAPGVTVMPVYVENDVEAVLQKIKDASARLEGQVSKSTCVGWKQAIERVAACNGWTQEQMSG